MISSRPPARYKRGIVRHGFLEDLRIAERLTDCRPNEGNFLDNESGRRRPAYQFKMAHARKCEITDANVVKRGRQSGSRHQSRSDVAVTAAAEADEGR